MRISPLDGYDASHIRLRVPTPEPYNGERELTCERFKRLRLARNLTQAQVAKRLDITNVAVSRWETGHTHPTWTMLAPVARVLGCSIDYLVTGRESAR